MKVFVSGLVQRLLPSVARIDEAFQDAELDDVLQARPEPPTPDGQVEVGRLTLVAPAGMQHPGEDVGFAVEAAAPDAGDKPRGFLTKVAKTIDKGHRWYLERDEPDAAGRWDDDHRRSMLRYVYDRDGGRCGICTAEMKIKGAQIEHVVPKVFVLFDVGRGGRAEPGTRYKSRLHKINNLQAGHTYCNKRKGNTPDVDKWRHPTMPPLTVADTQDGTALVLPRESKT